MLRSFLPLSLLALLLALSANAAIYRVDNVRGNDAADGLQAPLQTLARALPLLKPGDTLLLTANSEPYRESIPLLTHGTATAPIIIDGGGATITGADTAPQDGWANHEGIYSHPQATEVKFLFGPGVCYEQGKSPTQLQPLEWFWKAGELFFRPAADKTPSAYDLQMSVRVSGVLTMGAGQIIVRNLTAMHFWNDGFNLHNGSGPLWFENIRGLWNGDEGFSAHENCECYVRGGEFSHNYWHGVADVGLARTYYQNVVCRDNRSKGLFLIGGMHTLTDCEVSGSPAQIVLSPSDLREFPRLEQHPLRVSLTHLRSVRVQSAEGQTGVIVMGQATAILEHCLLQGGKIGLQVEAAGRAHVCNSILQDATDCQVLARGDYAADYNLYFPARLTIGQTTYAPEQFATYQQATGNDAKSLIVAPQFIPGTNVSSLLGPAAGAAYYWDGYGGPDLGLELRGPRPTENLPARLSYDFEDRNPWSRVYPEPVKNEAGTAVTFATELTTEQAHAGQRSGKFALTVPPGLPAAYNLKLFSEKLPFARPVKVVSLWLYGDGSGRTYCLRLRDAGGESFYRAPGHIDWSGWRQIVWNLLQEPPRNLGRGDGNQQQDVPPLEVVLDVGAKAGESVVLYVDDLEVQLQE